MPHGQRLMARGPRAESARRAPSRGGSKVSRRPRGARVGGGSRRVTCCFPGQSQRRVPVRGRTARTGSAGAPAAWPSHPDRRCPRGVRPPCARGRAARCLGTRPSRLGDRACHFVFCARPSQVTFLLLPGPKAGDACGSLLACGRRSICPPRGFVTRGGISEPFP